MDIKEKIIRDYFKSWIINDIKTIKESFNKDILYIESWGPAYCGLDELERWFTEWHKSSEVLAWDINKVIKLENDLICEWYFKCKDKNNEDEFNGVSWVSFDSNNKIIVLKEFMSVLPIRYPYKKQ